MSLPKGWAYLTQEYEIVYKPLWWHEKGLSQTASGYGSKLTTSKCVKLQDGRMRRVYVTQWSNAGTAWIFLDGMKLIVG